MYHLLRRQRGSSGHSKGHPPLHCDVTVLVDRLQKEIDAFLQDDTPDAFDRVVERLLQSPDYGVRWGRHWLDVARYAESTGNVNHAFPEAWRYRDYVIDAFNKDKPYDRFIQEQVAGDVLPAKTDALWPLPDRR